MISFFFNLLNLQLLVGDYGSSTFNLSNTNTNTNIKQGNQLLFF